MQTRGRHLTAKALEVLNVYIAHIFEVLLLKGPFGIIWNTCGVIKFKMGFNRNRCLVCMIVLLSEKIPGFFKSVVKI